MGSNINMNKNNNMDAALEPIDENRPAKNRRNDERNKQTEGLKKRQEIVFSFFGSFEWKIL